MKSRLTDTIAIVSSHLGSYFQFPTLCFWNTSDAFVVFQCLLGALASVLALLNVLPCLMFVLCWILYLSLATVGTILTAFPWDNILLETGLLCVMLAPSGFRPTLAAEQRGHVAPVSSIAVWLSRSLLLRAVVEPGLTKMLLGTSWRSLHGIEDLMNSQPLPSRFAWVIQALPQTALMGITAAVLFVELVVPIFLFFTKKFRRGAVAAIGIQQTFMFLCGGASFFHLVVLSLLLWFTTDDELPRWMRFVVRAGYTFRKQVDASESSIRRLVTHSLVAIVVVFLSLVAVAGSLMPVPTPLANMYQMSSPFRVVNQYGMFANVSSIRPAIVFEGSMDGKEWREFHLQAHPGPVDRAPPLIPMFESRVDWVMFAAASHENCTTVRWLMGVVEGLLSGKSSIEKLFVERPFEKPLMIRAKLFEFQMTNRQSDVVQNWWTRGQFVEFCPHLQLKSPSPSEAA
eukprot:TRINITY_DN4613_c0_g1_i2.p1 TRINITY_DN4613_c0_g1~~TRINITY_DN4613_c0_g1_i2.p1  ORF type:complete len:457 (+),score=53.51 TRINITY_DN4613_c0_g1_i2:258-1628(+)